MQSKPWYPLGHVYKLNSNDSLLWFQEKYLHEVKMKFKVGDKVRGNCRPGHPYSITVDGWVGTVTKVRTDDEMYVGDYLVDPRYFDLVGESATPITNYKQEYPATKEKKMSKRFVRLEKDTPIFSAGAILASELGNAYTPINELFLACDEAASENFGKAVVEAEESKDWFTRVYESKRGNRTVYLTKAEAQKAFTEETADTSSKSK